MSAFIVEDSTINKIVTWATACDSVKWQRSLLLEAGIDLHNAKDFGEKLFKMNTDAIEARYGKGQAKEFRDLTYRFVPKLAKTVEVYKAIQCLSYQCAEGDVPEQPLYKLLDSLEGTCANEIIRALPEYDTAPWG